MLSALLFVALGLPHQGLQDSLTLDSALATARAHRGQVAVAAAMVAAARADRRTARNVPNPLAAYSYSGDPPRQHLVFDQSLDWILRRGSVGAAGSAGIGVARADSVQLLAEVDRQARRAFHGALGTGRRLEMARDEAALADSLSGIAALRRAAGEISEFEAAQAALEAARAWQLVSASREEHAVAIAQLARALGVSPDALAAPTGRLDEHLSGAAPAMPALDALPMVAAARADSTMAVALYAAARWDRIPIPSLLAGVEWDDPTNPAGGSTVVLGAGLRIPLWQSGGAPAAAAEARADQVAAQLREVRADGARMLAEVAVRLEESARRAIVTRDSVVPLAVRQRELALVAYRAGETGIVPVFHALQAEREVGRDLVADLVAYQAARADWLALIGASE